MKSFFYKSCNCTLSCEYGVHRVDLQSPKKFEIFETFPNLINIFPHPTMVFKHLNLILMYFDPIYVEIMENENLEFCTFSPLTEDNFII